MSCWHSKDPHYPHLNPQTLLPCTRYWKRSELGLFEPRTKTTHVRIITRWMHNIKGWTWPSAHAEHGAVKCIWLHIIRMWLNLRPQNITRKYTRAHILWVRPSSIHKACCTQISPAHAAGGDVMDKWQHSIHLLLYVRRDWNSVTSTQAPWVRQY